MNQHISFFIEGWSTFVMVLTAEFLLYIVVIFMAFWSISHYSSHIKIILHIGEIVILVKQTQRDSFIKTSFQTV